MNVLVIVGFLGVLAAGCDYQKGASTEARIESGVRAIERVDEARRVLDGFLPAKEAALELLRSDPQIRRAEAAVVPRVYFRGVDDVFVEDVDMPTVAVYVETTVPLTRKEMRRKVDEALAAGGLVWRAPTPTIWSYEGAWLLQGFGQVVAFEGSAAKGR